MADDSQPPVTGHSVDDDRNGHVTAPPTDRVTEDSEPSLSPEADRKRRQRERQSAAGIKSVTVEVPHQYVNAVRSFARVLREAPGAGEAISLEAVAKVLGGDLPDPPPQSHHIEPGTIMAPPYWMVLGSRTSARIRFLVDRIPRDRFDILGDLSAHREGNDSYWAITFQSLDHLAATLNAFPAEMADIEFTWRRPRVAPPAAGESTKSS